MNKKPLIAVVRLGDLHCELCLGTEIRANGTYCGCPMIIDGVLDLTAVEDGFCRECHNSIKPGVPVKMRYGDHGRAVHARCS